MPAYRQGNRNLGYSIAAQKDLLRKYASMRGFVIEQEFMDVHSAWSAGRPGFEQALAYLQKHKECRILLVEKVDRSCRNLFDGAIIESSDVEAHFVKNDLVLSKASRASERYMYGVNVLNAKYHSDNLSEEVKKGMYTKAAQGLWPSYAPIGYLNVTSHQKKTIEPDPVLGPMMTKLFDWFTTAECSVKTLAAKAYGEGFRFRSGNKVPPSTIHKILRNPIYMGEFDYGGARYQGCHEPLVTRAVWERVQEILDGRHRKKHRKVVHEFPYSGMVRCGHCGCSLVGELKKGRYVYYHCTGYRGKCGEPYTREDVLKTWFAEALGQIAFPSATLQWLEAELMESHQRQQEARSQLLRRQHAELERLRNRQKVMYNDRLDGRIDVATYDEGAKEIRVHEQQIQQSIQAAQLQVEAAIEQRISLEALTCRMAELFLHQSAAEQRKLLHVVLNEAAWKQGELLVSFREPFEMLRRKRAVPLYLEPEAA